MSVSVSLSVSVSVSVIVIVCMCRGGGWRVCACMGKVQRSDLNFMNQDRCKT